MTTAELTTSTAAAIVLAEGQPLDQNPAAVYLASLKSAASRRGQQDALNTVAAILGAPELRTEPAGRKLRGDNITCLAVPWAGLRFQHTQAIRARLAERYAPATANKCMAALRGTLRAARLLRQLGQDDYDGCLAALKAVKGGSDEPAGRGLTPGELGGLLRACAQDLTPAGYRDAAIIALMYACGPRRSEVVGVDLADFTQTDDGEAWLTIRHGKGDKRRRVPITNGALEALQDWLTVRGLEPGALFCSINKGGRLQPGRMTAQAIFNMLAKRGQEAGLQGFSPHDMRRTFISDLLDAGADIATVQKLAGHANVTTTARYDRRGERAKRKAVDLLHVPYQRRRLA